MLIAADGPRRWASSARTTARAVVADAAPRSVNRGVATIVEIARPSLVRIVIA
jgi:hypothetical protein